MFLLIDKLLLEGNEMQKYLLFDESAWCYIEQLLPDDVIVKKVVLEDFIWFHKRPMKFKNDRQMIEAYAHHLELKANPVFETITHHSNIFKNVDVEKIRKYLLETFKTT